jgi:hypothetical protein
VLEPATSKQSVPAQLDVATTIPDVCFELLMFHLICGDNVRLSLVMDGREEMVKNP